MLRQADTEGRRQAHVDSVMQLAKTAARIQAWASMMQKDAGAAGVVTHGALRRLGTETYAAATAAKAATRGGPGFQRLAISPGGRVSRTPISGAVPKPTAPPAGAPAPMRPAPAAPGAQPTPGRLAPPPGQQRILPWQGVQAPMVKPGSAGMDKESMSLAPVKAVGSKIFGGLARLVGRGGVQAAEKGVAKATVGEAAKDVVGKLRPPVTSARGATAAGEIITPGAKLPQATGEWSVQAQKGRKAVRAAQSNVAAADAANLQNARFQQMQSEMHFGGAPKYPTPEFTGGTAAQSVEKAFGSVRPAPATAGQAGPVVRRRAAAGAAGQVAPAPTAAPAAAPAAAAPPAAPPKPGLQPPAEAGHYGGATSQPTVVHGRAGQLGAPVASAEAPAAALQEAQIARESAQAGLQPAPGARKAAPTARGEGAGPVNRTRAQREAVEAARTPAERAALAEQQTAKSFSRAKELERIPLEQRTPEQVAELSGLKGQKDVADLYGKEAREAQKRKLKWGLMAGIGLPAAALGYGALKAAPAVAGALQQSTMYPMAGAYGWSPVDYGYGSSPYGPGAVNLGRGA